MRVLVKHAVPRYEVWTHAINFSLFLFSVSSGAHCLPHTTQSWTRHCKVEVLLHACVPTGFSRRDEGTCDGKFAIHKGLRFVAFSHNVLIHAGPYMFCITFSLGEDVLLSDIFLLGTWCCCNNSHTIIMFMKDSLEACVIERNIVSLHCLSSLSAQFENMFPTRTRLHACNKVFFFPTSCIQNHPFSFSH